MRIGIYVVDCAAVDPYGRKQSRILASSRQIGTDAARVKED